MLLLMMTRSLFVGSYWVEGQTATCVCLILQHYTALLVEASREMSRTRQLRVRVSGYGGYVALRGVGSGKMQATRV